MNPTAYLTGFATFVTVDILITDWFKGNNNELTTHQKITVRALSILAAVGATLFVGYMSSNSLPPKEEVRETVWTWKNPQPRPFKPNLPQQPPLSEPQSSPNPSPELPAGHPQPKEIEGLDERLVTFLSYVCDFPKLLGL